jgi:ribonuclease HI
VTKEILIYVDGACSGNHLGSQRGRMGAGIVARCGPVEKAWGLPLGEGTNQRAEILAVSEALLRVKDRPNSDVRVYTDSQYAIGALTAGWKVRANPEIVDFARILMRECASFRMFKEPGHSGHPENERANELAVRAALTGQRHSE